MIKKTMRVVAAHPRIGVPFPGNSGEKLRDQPRNVPASPYWLRYLGMGIVLDAPRVLEVQPRPVPVSGPIVAVEE